MKETITNKKKELQMRRKQQDKDIKNNDLRAARHQREEAPPGHRDVDHPERLHQGASVRNRLDPMD